MKNLSQLSKITKHNVVNAFFHEEKCYHLLVRDSNGLFWKSYYVDGQKIGISLFLPKKKKPLFLSNVK